IDAIVMFGYTALAAQLGRYIRSPNIMTRMNKLFGSMFMGCGMLLATAKA
ncbi:TPA: homoserine/homoserine lactone efflux protein, partial [Vibrio cholerae]|nr:homoserine/homoserine lactone efflux protein [Vibrio cholerae]